MTKPLLGNEALRSGQKSKNPQSVTVLSIDLTRVLFGTCAEHRVTLFLKKKGNCSAWLGATNNLARLDANR